MENIIFGAEIIIGIILGVIAIAAVGFIASIVIGVIVSVVDDAKANKKNKEHEKVKQSRTNENGA